MPTYRKSRVTSYIINCLLADRCQRAESLGDGQGAADGPLRFGHQPSRFWLSRSRCNRLPASLGPVDRSRHDDGSREQRYYSHTYYGVQLMDVAFWPSMERAGNPFCLHPNLVTVIKIMMAIAVHNTCEMSQRNCNNKGLALSLVQGIRLFGFHCSLIACASYFLSSCESFGQAGNKKKKANKQGVERE